LTTTSVVPTSETQPSTATVTVYSPEAAVVTDGIDGFCSMEANPLGPVHEYTASMTAPVVRCSVSPAHIGPSLDGLGVAGGVHP
jgi:hypothetical protein